ncbi:endo-1,4-beta-xylanase [Catenuloplanes japonicus]|uniref:endo-1,4-beta-xylanase n=1 Tax=Catenuloplanes japonicus TaxID=33876 RepID=UPI000527F4AB|nr:endo-1,4-beta-xylanase [Catenuloplanes japonicus]
MRAWTRLAPVVAAGLAAALLVPLMDAQADEAGPVTVVTSTFEDGTTGGWVPRGAEVLSHSTTVAHGGTGSLAIAGRTRTWEGPVLDVLGTFDKGVRYTISVWVRLATGSDSARLSVERRTGGTASYDQVVGNTALTAGAWVNLTGTYTLATDVEYLTVYVETASGFGDLHLDDVTISYVPDTPIQTDIPSVKDVVAEFPVGAAITPAALLGEHGKLLAKHFDSITPGNALKWDATEPAEGTFRFADADAMVTFAKAHGQAVRGHTLVWHNQTPAWVFLDANGNAMTATPENKALLLARLEAHIRGVAGHYGADIPVWDVVNEVIDESQSDGYRRSRWYEITGLDYIRTAFRVTREVLPNAKLFINDYNTNVPAKRDKLHALVALLKSEGVPVDGVGHQMHVNIDWPSTAETEAMITTFVPLGVEQQITEMDVSIYTGNGESFPAPPADRLLKVAYKYRDLFALYRRYATEITSVTVWGLADDDTWLDTFPVTRKDAPLLFDTRLQAKDAYWGVVDPSKIGTTTPAPTPTGGATAGACAVTYRVTGQWQGGFQGDVKITNTSAAALSSWTLGWNFTAGQQLSQLWGGTGSQSGTTVTVRNASWNGTLAPGASTGAGFLASWTGTNPAPSAFTLNGTACTSA